MPKGIHGLGRAQSSCSIHEQYALCSDKIRPKTRILTTDKARRSIVIMKGSVPGPLSAYNNHGSQLMWSGDIIAKLVVGCRPRRSALPLMIPKVSNEASPIWDNTSKFRTKMDNTRFCAVDFAGFGSFVHR